MSITVVLRKIKDIAHVIFFLGGGGADKHHGRWRIANCANGELIFLCNQIKLFFLLSSLGYSSLPCRVLNFQITIQNTREICRGLAWNHASASYS